MPDLYHSRGNWANVYADYMLTTLEFNKAMLQMSEPIRPESGSNN